MSTQRCRLKSTSFTFNLIQKAHELNQVYQYYWEANCSELNFLQENFCLIKLRMRGSELEEGTNFKQLGVL